MAKVTIRGGIFTYLLCACTVTVVCTVFFIRSCNCDSECANLTNDRVISPRHRIGSKPSLPSTYLMVAIMSHANNSVERTIIRDTWLKLSGKGVSAVRHVFALGTQDLPANVMEHIEEEQRLYGDLLLLNTLLDSYDNLTRKTLWTIDALCKTYEFKFLLKVDSDSFVRLGALSQNLRNIEHPYLYWGFLDGRARPRRKGKWAEKEWVICDRYVPYQLGGGYVLAYSLAEFISKNKDLLKLYRNEDVSVGAWLAGLNVKYVHDPRFDTEFRSRGCNNEYLITHKQSPAVMEVDSYTEMLLSTEDYVKLSFVPDRLMYMTGRSRQVYVVFERMAHLYRDTLVHDGTNVLVKLLYSSHAGVLRFFN